MSVAEYFAKEFESIPFVTYDSGNYLKDEEQVHTYRYRLAQWCEYDVNLDPRDSDSSELYCFFDGSTVVVHNPTQAWGTAAWVELGVEPPAMGD